MKKMKQALKTTQEIILWNKNKLSSLLGSGVKVDFCFLKAFALLTVFGT